MKLHHPRTLVAVLAALALVVPVGGAMAHEDGDESENGPLEVEARPSIVPVGNRVFVEAEYEVDGDERDEEDGDERGEDGDEPDDTESDDEGDEEDDTDSDDDSESGDEGDEEDDAGAQQTAGLPTTVTFSVDWGTGAQPETMTVTEEDADEDSFESEAIASRPMEEAGAFPVTVTATPDVGEPVSAAVTVQVGQCSAGGLEDHDEPSEDGEADDDEVARCVYDSLPDIVGDAHAASVIAVFSNGIVQGKADGTYGPQDPVTRAQMATFLARALDLWASEDAELPADVDAGNPHADAIAAVIEEAIALGKADGSFKPNEPVSRGQMAAFLDRAFDLVEQAGGDLPEDAEGTVHERAIEAVVDNGIAQGFADGTFRPGDSVTRGQMATFLARALDL